MSILTMVLTPVLATWGLGGATEHGRLEVVGHIKVLHLRGSYYEMGKAHGQLLRAEIAAARKDHTVREWSDPQQKKEWEASHRDPWIKHVPKRCLEEIRGLAEGAGLPLHVMEYAQELGYGFPRSRALVLHGSKTVAGRAILAQATEFSWFSELLVIVYHPTDGFPHVVLTCPGCLNALAGMNREGVAISANVPYHENYGMERCLKGFHLREALRQAKSELEAVSFLEKAQPADHAMFLVAGRNSCDCRVVERTPKLTAVFEANDPSEKRTRTRLSA